ncbi:MAG: YaiO family outer membrane beta-barrel protein [Gemmatimonadaceae bacterium]|nr:YaiO family outer membrane beta-barrel protein [Gemmatimonadaceae bacterium]
MLGNRRLYAGLYLWIGLAASVIAAPRLSAQVPSVQGSAARDSGSLVVDYGYTTFRGDIDPWRLASLSLSRRTDRGSIIGRLNFANRFSTSGVQVEMDAYPRLSRNTYAYLNAGYSAADIFPTWRAGGELYGNFPRGLEASLGFRHLRFGGPPVTLFTGTVARYIGNYWISARPFVRFKDSGTSLSAGLTARRYFADGDHYVGATVSYGSSPSDRVTPDAVERTNSFSAGIHGSSGISHRTLLTWSAFRDREELDAGRIRNSLGVTAGFRFLFQ